MKIYYHDDHDTGYVYFATLREAEESALKLAEIDKDSIVVIGMEADVTAENFINALNGGGIAKRHWDASVAFPDGKTERIRTGSRT